MKEKKNNNNKSKKAIDERNLTIRKKNLTWSLCSTCDFYRCNRTLNFDDLSWRERLIFFFFPLDFKGTTQIPISINFYGDFIARCKRYTSQMSFETKR